jgi:hypothetical protein
MLVSWLMGEYPLIGGIHGAEKRIRRRAWPLRLRGAGEVRDDERFGAPARAVYREADQMRAGSAQEAQRD